MAVLLNVKTFTVIIAILFASLYVGFLQSDLYIVIKLPPPATVPEDVTTVEENMVKNVVRITGGESIVSYKGNLVTGTLDGNLVGFNINNHSIIWSVPCPPNSKGTPCRILGIRSLDDILYGVDEHCRLFKFQNDKFTWLLDENHRILKDLNPGFFNDLVVSKNMVYISDSFTYNPALHPLQRFFSFENSGRILGYNLKNGELQIVAEGLYLPNGIELYDDNQSLLVSECSMFRIVRLDIESGTISPFITYTFGAVDNIRRSQDGGYWIGLSATRFTSSSLPDFLGKYPALRHILTNKALLPLLLIHDMVFGAGPALYKIDSKGNTLKLLTDPNKLTKTVSFSEVHEVGDRIFVGTPFSPNIFVFPNLK